MEAPGQRPSHPDHSSPEEINLDPLRISQGSVRTLDEQHLCALGILPTTSGLVHKRSGSRHVWIQAHPSRRLPSLPAQALWVAPESI